MNNWAQTCEILWANRP